MIKNQWTDAVFRALDEDCASADLTTNLLAPATELTVSGTFLAQGELVVAGIPAVIEVFDQLDGRVRVDPAVEDGTAVSDGDTIAVVTGPAGILLSGERVALNFLQHLSGIATAARNAVKAVEGTGATVADTRKTTPGLRWAEKYAVRMGGCENHRGDLAEAFFMKDNHWELLEAASRDLPDLLACVPKGKKVVVEVDDEAQFERALRAGVTHIMVDNQPPSVVRQRVKRAGDGVTIEASGGITLENVREYALAGADVISMGCLTHSVIAARIGFEIKI